MCLPQLLPAKAGQQLRYGSPKIGALKLEERNSETEAFVEVESFIVGPLPDMGGHLSGLKVAHMRCKSESDCIFSRLAQTLRCRGCNTEVPVNVAAHDEIKLLAILQRGEVRCPIDVTREAVFLPERV